MSSQHRPDPVELLAKLAPPTTDYLEPGDDQAADELLDKIVNTPRPAPRRHRNRRRIIGGTIGAVVLASGGAVAARTWWSSDTPVRSTISCYSEASRLPAIQIELTGSSSESPVQRCTRLWTDGQLSTTGAPELTTCVSAAGIAVVMPGTPATCDQLQLAVYEPTNDAPTDRSADIVEALSDRFTDQCLDRAEATTAAQQILDDLHLDEWNIAQAGDDSTGDSCHTAFADDLTKTVTVLAIPRSP